MYYFITPCVGRIFKAHSYTAQLGAVASYLFFLSYLSRNTLSRSSYSLHQSLMLFFHRLLFLLAGVSAASLFALADIRLPLREDNDVSMGSHTEVRAHI